VRRKGNIVTKQIWTDRIAPSFVCLVVAGCVWYALDSRPQMAIITPTTSHASAQPTTGNHVNVAPLAVITPTISKQEGQVQFSVDTKTFQQVQKVEFYIENKFIGAAFSQPFSVTVDENNITAGTHTVTAKLYTPTSTAQTTPVLFDAKPTTPPPANVEESVSPTTPSSTIPNSNPANPPPTVVVATPTGLAVDASADGTAAHLGWYVTPGVVTYQVWRDGTQITAVATTSYEDNSLTPGQTYEYRLVAIDADSNQSTPSSQVAVTVPTSPPVDNSQSDTPDKSQSLVTDNSTMFADQ
jgi:hypothetical protein